MAQENPYAKYVPAQPAPQAPPPVTNNAPPPFIGGTVSPTKQASEARAQSAEQRAQRSEQRAAEDQEMQRRRLALEEDKAARDKGGASANESERKAAAFLIRALGSNSSYEKQKVGPRSYVGQKLAETAPDFLNTLPAGIGNSPQRQVADTNQDEFIAASLRQDSGAAIPEQEMERQRRIYFPMPGDSEETIKAKREARIRAIEGLKQSAGRLEPSAQQRYDALAAEVGIAAPDANSPVAGTANGVTPPDGTPGPQNGQNGLRQYYENGVLVNEEDVVGTVDGNSSFFSSFFRMPRDANEVWEALKSGTGDLVQGGGDVLGIVGNPLNATINAVAGTNLSTDLGSSLREDLGFKPSDGDAVSAINRAAAGGLLTGGTAALGSKVGALPGMARNALAQYGATPVTDAVTAGTAAAAGEGARQAGAGPGGQFAATIAGGFTPAGAMGLARRVGSGPKVNALAAEVMGPFERSNVPMRQADFDPAARPQRAALEKSDKGRPIIQAADEADQTAMEARLSEIGGAGRVADSPYETGAMVQGALTRQGDRTKTAARARYERAEKLSGNPAIEPTQAIGATARHVADLTAGGANTNAGEIKFLTGLGEDLSAPGGKTISQLRDMRTNLRGRLKEQGLDYGQAEARALDIMDAAAKDIEVGLKGNPRALEQYKAGDKIWRERAEFRKDITQRLVGKNGEKSAIDTATAVNLLAKKDPMRLKRLMDEFEPEEQADFVATVAANLGKSGKGEFSPAILLSNLDPRAGKISPEAARKVFGDDGLKALKDLQAVARSKVAARSDTAPSGAAIQNMKRGLRSAIFTGLGFTTGGAGGAIAAPLLDNFLSNLGDARKARLLTNPVFTKQLRNAPETTNPKAINTYFDRMTQSAAKSPVFAMDVEAFKQALAGAANKSTTAAAAGEQEQN